MMPLNAKHSYLYPYSSCRIRCQRFPSFPPLAAIMPIPAEVISLAHLTPGQCAEVVEVDGGRAMTQRMLMLGIRRGTGLCVVQGPSKRGVVVRVGGARIALGRGVTEQIRVQPSAQLAGFAQ